MGVVVVGGWGGSTKEIYAVETLIHDRVQVHITQ